MSEKNKSESVWFTTAVNKYPSFRDHPLKGVWRWLEGRRADDNAEGLWRVHDKLYDLKAFVKNHPGGPDWLNLTMVFMRSKRMFEYLQNLFMNP